MVAPQSTKRPAPPVYVPPAIRTGNGMPSKRARDLNVMLKDLGFLDGKPTSSYGNDTRNGVSLLQQRLRADGVYQGAPHGRFDDATRAALIADEQIPTYEA